MEIIVGIYKITNPKGRIYIGLSQNILKRWESYKQPSNIKSQKFLYNSLRKYGWKEHVFEILERCDKELLSSREIYWIKFLGSYYYENSNGLNLTEGGSFPQKRTEPLSEEHKNKIRNKLLGHAVSSETKEKLRLANLGKTLSLETKNKISNWHLHNIHPMKKGHSKESKERMSKNKIGKDSNNKKSVICIIEDAEILFQSLTEASIYFNIRVSSISNNLKGLTKTTKIKNNKVKFKYA